MLLTVDNVPCGPPSQLTLPLTGRPWADVTLSLAYAENRWQPGDQVALDLQDGPSYRMTVISVGPLGGFLRMRLTCGTGGLSSVINAKWYRQIPAEKVLREILQDCGEAVGSVSLPGTLPMWTRLEGPAHEALRALMMGYPAYSWRMTPDGKVNVGAESWPEHGAPVAVESEDAAAGTYVCSLSTSLLPGEHLTLSRGVEKIAKRVTRVMHSISQTTLYPAQTLLRTIVGTGDGEDIGVSGLEQSIRRTMRHTDYHALRPAIIIRDHGDHTVDLEVLEAGFPQLSHVPLLVRVPGVRVKVKAGSAALLSFQQGNPAQPVAECRDGATLQRLDLFTASGAHLTLEDDRGGVSPEESPGGHPCVTLTDQAGQSVQMDGIGGTITINANRAVTLNAPKVHLAHGGIPIALKGHRVSVPGIQPGGSTAIGTIIEGSADVDSS